MPRATSSGRRVRFRGAQVLEFDAAQPPVVRLGGAGRQLPAVTTAAAAAAAGDAAALALELEARGLSAPDELRRAYASELRTALQSRGFGTSSVSDISGCTEAEEDAATLERQLTLAELLLAQAALDGDGVSASSDGDDDDCDNDDPLALDADAPAQALPRLQLAKKRMAGVTDDGYVFGRRFVSVAAFINAFEFEELAAMAQQRGIAVPELPAAEREKLTAVERELCARHSSSGMGKPLKQLTLRELTVEARARELIVVRATDRDGKRSKKALIEKLRPVLRQEVLDEKIRDKRDDLLRALLLDVLEEEAARDRTRAVLAVVRRHLARLGREASAADVESDSSSNTSPEAMAVDDSSDLSTATAVAVGGRKAEVESCKTRFDDGDEDASEQLQRAYRQLLERLESAQQPPR